MKYCHGIIEIWMRNHLVSVSNCNIVNLRCPNFSQEMTNTDKFTCTVGDKYVSRLQSTLSKTILIESVALNTIYGVLT